MKVLFIADNEYLRKFVEKKFNFQGITIIQSDDVNFKSKIEEDWDFLLSLHCRKIIPKNVLDKTRCYNLHPGIFPLGRGVMPYIFAIINKEKAGCTLHRMTENLDRGYIIDQKEIEIDPWDTGDSLQKKILKEETILLLKNFKSLLNGSYDKIVDPEGGFTRNMKDFQKLLQIQDIKTIDILRALSKKNWNNAYILDGENKIYLHLITKKN